MDAKGVVCSGSALQGVSYKALHLSIPIVSIPNGFAVSRKVLCGV